MQVKPTERFEELLDLLHQLNDVETEEHSIYLQLFNSGAKYRPYNFLNDSWFDHDMTDYFEDQFIEFAAEDDGSSFCLWFYEGLVGEPPVVYIGTDYEFCTVAPSMEDFICLKILNDEPSLFETKPKEIWEELYLDEEDEPEIYNDVLKLKKVASSVIENCRDRKSILKDFKMHPKFHKWVKKVEKKDEALERENKFGGKTYEEVKSNLLTELSKKATGDLYLKLIENEETLKDRDYEQISSYLEKALETEPNNIEVLEKYVNENINHKSFKINSSKYNKANEIYTRLIELHTNPIPFYKGIASWYRKNGDLDSALQYYEKDLLEYDANDDSFVPYSDSYSQEQIMDICEELKSKDGLKILEETVERTPNKETYKVLYKQYCNKKEYKKAFENALNIIEYGDETTDNFRLVGEKFFNKGLYVEALALFEKIINNKKEFEDKDAITVNAIGLCHLRMEPVNVDKALEAFKKAYNLNPENEKYKESVEHIEKLLEEEE